MSLILDFVRALIWPAVAVATLMLFRHQIKSLLDRLSSARWGNVHAEFQQQAELPSHDVEPPVEASDDLFADESAAVAEIYSRELEKQREIVEKLVEENAGWRTAYHFERTYNLIFGSQLRLLAHLAERADAGVGLPTIYGFYASGFPGGPMDRFQPYVDFLKVSGLVEETPANHFRITALGVRFLQYLGEMKYPQLKPF